MDAALPAHDLCQSCGKDVLEECRQFLTIYGHKPRLLTDSESPSLIYGFLVIPETVSERSAALTAASNSADEVRFSPRLKARIFERKFDTVVSV